MIAMPEGVLDFWFPAGHADDPAKHRAQVGHDVAVKWAPQMNEVLGRTSTAAEIEYLAKEGAAHTRPIPK